jgi:hypothetical protein
MMMWGPFLNVAVSAFIPICISVNLNISWKLESTFGERLAALFSLYLWTYIFVWLPFVMLYVIFAGRETQANPDFK